MSGVGKGGRYPAELRERAVRMVLEHQHEYPSQWKAIESVAEKLAVHRETLRVWVRRAVRPWVWRGDWPIGALAAGEVFRVALARIAARVGRSYPTQCPPPGIVDVDLELGPRPRAAVGLGDVDLVSAGAITNGMLFALLRVPNVSGRLRVFDDDVAELSNLNRYGLLRRNGLGCGKTTVLEQYATSSLAIAGVATRFDREAVAHRGMARRVVVGADHIPTRWVAQELAPDWLGVGATSHFFALVSSHSIDGPCAGCVHPYDDPFDNARIPTVSVVSFFSGLLTAIELLSVATGEPRAGTVLSCFPVGLVETDSCRALRTYRASGHPACPVGCKASRFVAPCRLVATAPQRLQPTQGDSALSEVLVPIGRSD